MQPDSALASRPIGVFDSGVGGLSVLRQLLRLLPQEDFVYLADTAWAPYGERSTEEIQQRSLAITRHLVDTHAIKLLVVACNTATAQAVHAIREAYPALPIVGIEPAIKPAAALTLTGHIGIMATHATVQSQRFQRLVQEWSGDRQMHIQACNGLALAIENALENQANPDGETVESLCRRYVQALGSFVQDDAINGIDTLVLGCTHYPLLKPLLRDVAGPQVRLIDSALTTAEFAAERLQQAGLARTGGGPADYRFVVSDVPLRFQTIGERFLGRSLGTVEKVDW